MLRAGFEKLLTKFTRRACRIESCRGLRFAYNPRHPLYVREYYLYCVGLFKQKFMRIDATANVIFGDYAVDFGNGARTLRVDIQHEHTLVKPQGRDSAGSPTGVTPIHGSADRYLVRISNYDYLRQLDTVIEYSMPNLVHVRESGLFADYMNRIAYLAPLLYDAKLCATVRNIALLSLMFDTRQPRRRRFIDAARHARLPLMNVNRVFAKDDLASLYDRTQILVNVHQTDHHDTLEELRILPALLRGVVIVSEDVPLKEQVPYHRFVIWAQYANLVDTVRTVRENYEHYRSAIFDSGELSALLADMARSNSDNIDCAVRRMLCS